MKTEILIPGQSHTSNRISLCGIVDQLAEALEPAASIKKSYILNDVPQDIQVDADSHLLASVLGGLVNEVIRYTENGCVRVTAKSYNDVILLHVKNDGTLHYDSFSHNIARFQLQAKKLGGFVGFTSYRNKITTIAFSFMNRNEPAPAVPGLEVPPVYRSA